MTDVATTWTASKIAIWCPDECTEVDADEYEAKVCNILGVTVYRFDGELRSIGAIAEWYADLAIRGRMPPPRLNVNIRAGDEIHEVTVEIELRATCRAVPRSAR